MLALSIEPGLWLPLALGGVALVVVAWAGWLRPGALAAGPARATGLAPFDVLIGLGLMIAGAAVGGLVARELIGGGDELTAMQWVQRMLMIQFIGQGAPIVYLLVRLADKSGLAGGLRAIGLRPRRPGRELGAAVLGILLGIPLTLGTMALFRILTDWWGMPEPEQIGHEMLIKMRDAASARALGLMLLSAVLLAPVFEEVIYRGLLQSALQSAFGQRGRWGLIAMVSALFTAMHIGPATFDPALEGGVALHALPALFVLALVLGWLYERTGSLWPPILLHVAFNALNVFFVLVVLDAQ